LKKASVVDAGAKGFVHFVYGFIKCLKGDTTISDDIIEDVEPLDLRHVHGEVEVIQHRYCTEAMLTGSSKTTKEVQNLLKPYGDSLIVAGSQRKMRVHIHANKPIEVFESLRTIGHVVYQKVDDMVMQNNLVVNRKYKIALVTDSIADLPQSFVEDHQIHVVNLDILYKDDMYMDKMTINNKMAIEFVEANGERATSSQPELKRINLLFETLSSYYDDIIVLTVSKALSGTHNVFQKAAQTITTKTNIDIIDTKQNSAAQGLLVMTCAQQIKEGKSREEVVTYMNAQIAKSKILVSVKNLSAMIKSGRLSTKGGKIANLVNLKPIVTLDENGEGGLGGIAFSHKSSLNKITKKLIKLNNEIGLSSYGIVHIENPEEALVYGERLKKVLGMEPEFMEDVSSIVALGAGEGAIAVGYITK
jgi:DegV family protein with EDD domain